MTIGSHQNTVGDSQDRIDRGAFRAPGETVVHSSSDNRS